MAEGYVPLQIDPFPAQTRGIVAVGLNDPYCGIESPIYAKSGVITQLSPLGAADVSVNYPLTVYDGVCLFVVTDANVLNNMRTHATLFTANWTY